MTFADYINSLKKITLKDIGNIIDQNLVNDDKASFFGFRMQRGFLKFGKLEDGLIPEPYLFIVENEDTLCQDLYDILQNKFSDNCEFSCARTFSGDYEYFANINNKLGFCFPSYNSTCQKWIHERVALDRQNSRIKTK